MKELDKLVKIIKKEFLPIKQMLTKTKRVLFMSYKQDISYNDYTSTHDLYTEYFFDRLYGTEIEFCEFSDVSLVEDKYYIKERNIEDYDFLFFGFISSFTQTFKPLIEFIKEKKIPYLQYGNCVDIDHKVFEMNLIKRLGYSYIPTIMCSKLYNVNLNYIKEKIGFPCVVKPINGSNGRGVYKVENEKSLKKRIKESAPALVQKYIENQGDFRVILLKNKVVLVSKRVSENEEEFRNNASLGGKIYKSEIPDNVKNILEIISTYLPYDIVGADVIFDKDGNYYILEMNSGPSYFKFSKACEVDVASLICDHISKTIN